MSETEVIQLDAGQEVNNVAAGSAHHMATGHIGGGAGEDYECGECDFQIADGIVRVGGPIRVLADGREVPK